MSYNNILSCDIGLKRIGIACYIQGLILPLPPIIRKNRNQASSALSQILLEREIHTLIVGIPDYEDGKTHEMERRIKHFISLVNFKGEILYINEALSSKIAQESLLELGKKERKEKIKNGELDSLSAMEILKRYLSQIF
ncbi:Holliday junction resolvase RuvX [Helicobacter pametensis]|uniref:Holliday junction resolvase RuvX n=1 Tax=Helicobacter pametensis TaxID=95149 RepID=UPI0004AF9781|nr:Holliday junction resolvase RuvX [Helicobacter pametensis]